MQALNRTAMGVALGLTCIAYAAPSLASDAQSVVQQQLNAYNAHDIRAFMATYDPGAEVVEFPAKPLMKGAAQIQEFYETKRFNDPRLHATVDKRIVMGNVVIDYEQILNTQAAGPGRMEAIAIYEVNDGKITKVTLIRGSASLDKQ
ncbi:nuclear transport factor 2 family protein [Rugamonas apoptosis]|uniref:Nuclear transport factor 2 family protein n=1 Tax=Rugamonas apoptosis TaxID=2758570 RepID=A0A7W2FEW5_9BURK|nr:nuclear transport factor 2 family protein [Rugamonas apoptosis]MBA5690457.1 nuclear transport factor 2 family protein [Rugamonas apoptosis]